MCGLSARVRGQSPLDSPPSPSEVTEVFVNCPRYIHQYQRIATSKYVPQPDKETPLPSWKRIEGLQDALPAQDRQKVGAMGTVTPEEYAELVMKGQA